LRSPIFNSATNGYDYKYDHEVLTILANVTIASLTGNGVASDNTLTASSLLNKGTILSGTGEAVGFLVGNSNITNTASGSIIGSDGVDMLGGGHQKFNNFGKVIANGSIGVYFYQANHGSVLNNYGSIVSGGYGVLVQSSFVGGYLDNHNYIYGKTDGILIGTASNLNTSIHNAASGTIQGKGDAILADQGRFTLHNAGKIVGSIVDADPGSARDVIFNSGHIQGRVVLGNGNDLFDGTHGTSGTIFAGSGNDRIIGGNGNLAIHLGGGNDTVTAGPGHDQFIFDAPLAGQVDKITNFTRGLDKIVLSEAVFAGIAPGPGSHALLAADFVVGGQATSLSQHIIYDTRNGALFYDPDGSDPLPKVHFATLPAHLHLAHADFLVVA
jgi:Ca2+-binding RTX toxin-like protein